MRSVRLTALIIGVLVVTPTAAAAHPAFTPKEVPAGDRYDVDLVIPHGCGVEGERPTEGDEASPTVEIAVGLTDRLTAIEPRVVEGWTTEVEESGDGPSAVVWRDDGGATTEPITLPLTITLVGEAGAHVDVPVFQRCVNDEAFRWIGTPDEPADLPAARLTVAQPGAGPSPAPSRPPADGAADAAGEPADGSAGTEPPAAEPRSPAPSPSAAGSSAASEPATESAAAEDDADNGPPWGLAAVLLAAGAAIVVLVVRRRS